MAPQAQRKVGEASPTRDRILRIAASLFAERGYSAVGVNEIGEVSGLGRGALYYHISSKEDLLYDITTAYMTDLVESGRRILAEEADAVARVSLLSRALMGAIANHLSEMTVCFRELHALTADRRLVVMGLHGDYQAIWSKCIADGAKTGAFRKVPAVVLKGLLGMYFYSFLWLDPKGPSTAEQIGDAFTDIVLKSIRA